MKTRTSIQELLRKLYTLLYTAIFALIFLQAVIVAVKETGWKVIPAAVLFALAVCFAAVRILKSRRPDSFYVKVWWILQAASCVVMLIFIWKLEMKLHWDWQEIIQGAYEIAVNGKVNDHQYRYFARYTNNQFWLSCMAGYFRVLHLMFPSQGLRFMKLASMCLAVLMTQLTLTMFWQSARLWMKEQAALLTGMLMLGFLPIYLYAAYSYTDTPGMFVTALLIWLFSLKEKGAERWTDAGPQRRKRRKILITVAFGLACALAIRVKITAFIFVIALCIEMLLQKGISRQVWKQRLVQAALVLLCMAAGLGLTGLYTKKNISITPEDAYHYEFPLGHWIMMGLYEHGGYTHDMYDYTVSFIGLNEKKAAVKEKTAELLKEMGPVGLIRHIFGDKLRFTWTKSMLRGDWFGTKYPMQENWLWHHLSIEGIAQHKTLYYTWSYWLFLLAGLVLSGISGLRGHSGLPGHENTAGKTDPAAIARLSLLGTFLFLSLWEANARYLVPMIPLLMAAAADGWLRKVGQ